jgi:copper resistance protein D
MALLFKIALVVHVLSAIIWVGGVLFIAMVGVPSLNALKPELKRRLLIDMGRRFRTIGWSCLALLVLTGSFMMWTWGATWSNVLDLSFFAHGHTALLGKKLLLVLVMLVTTGVHDWWLGPKSARQGSNAPSRERDRKLASFLGRLTGILVIAIVLLAVFVARPWL